MDSNSLERVQRRFTKLCTSIKIKTYSGRLAELKLPTLEERRTRGDMIMPYKTLNYHENMFSEFFDFNTRKSRGHSLKLNVPRVNSEIRSIHLLDLYRLGMNWTKELLVQPR